MIGDVAQVVICGSKLAVLSKDGFVYLLQGDDLEKVTEVQISSVQRYDDETYLMLSCSGDVYLGAN